MKVESSTTIVHTDNDIAIIGMSCRFPGDVNSPDAFWRFLLDGGDGIIDVPADRWDNAAYYDADPDRVGKMYVNRGGFIHAIDQFDPQFFGISPKEAPHIDPQHRWLLELTYEALENAGLKAGALKGSDTAVYIGQFMHDYEQLQLDAWAHKMMMTHSATGPSMTLTANRISYAFDFTGPSVTLDTACSSSLVALDMACKALQNGDSKLAIAGGVNILLRPELTMSICKASMLSPDCQCKSFDASANGYVRSEGAGIVLVKKLKDALQEGDTILAVIKATGVNQDGQTIGITVPNGESQKKLLVQSLTRAGIEPSDIQYAEAHGTGTAVGDPIEVNALGETLGERDADLPQCIIGSVKSNIGHMEAAAGMAGLAKTVLAMQAGLIPKNIHFNLLNPAINLQALNVRIADRPLPWPDTQNKPRHAIVNSFGFGGTNANVVLEQAPVPPAAGIDQKPVVNSDTKWLLISSKTEQGLKDQAEKYVRYFHTGEDTALHDVCYTAAVKREHHKHRLVINGTDRQAMLRGLEDFIDSRPAVTYAQSVSHSGLSNRIAFVFSGMGPQWFGMGRALYDAEPVFRDMLDRCDEALHRYAGWSLRDKLYHSDEREHIHATYVAQPAIFAIQVAVAELLNSWGIQPSYVVGHSAGEVAAAYVAGALSFDDAVKVIYHRSRLQHSAEGTGKMLAVGISEAALQPYLAGVESRVSIAAINSEQAVTLAGDEQVLASIADQLDAQGKFARLLKVNVPYHSPVMDRLREPMLEALRDIQALTPNIPLYSTVFPHRSNETQWDAEYWADNVREPVLFKATIDCIVQAGADAFVEIAPHPVLSGAMQENIEQSGRKAIVIATLKREQNDVVMLSQTLALLHVSGIPIDWKTLYPDNGRLVNLPNYAWQHAGYWWESDDVQQVRLKNLKQRSGFSEPVHPLLGSKLHSTSPIWQKTLDLHEQRYLIDHQVEGNIVYPGAAYIEMALAIADLTANNERITLEDIEFKRPLFLDKEKPATIEGKIDEQSGRFQISAIDSQTGQWSVFSQGVISDIGIRPPAGRMCLEQLLKKFSQQYDREDFYQHCHRLGLTYEKYFQAVNTAWYSNDEALVEVVMSESLAESADQYYLHPVILDGAFQGLFPLINKGYLPVKIAELHYYRKPDKKCFCYLKMTYKDDFQIIGDLTLFDSDGNSLLEIFGCELKATETQMAFDSAKDSILYDFKWQQQPLAGNSPPENGHWIIFSDEKGIGRQLAAELEKRFLSVSIINQNGVYEQTDNHHFSVQVNSSEDIVPVIARFAETCRGIIYLWGLDSETGDTAEDILAACQSTAITPMYLAQALDKVNWQRRLDVCLVSQSAWRLQGELTIPQPVQGALWGFGRVFAAEHPEHRISMIDVANDIDDSLIGQLADDIVSSGYEQEIALRASGRYVNRLRKINDNELDEYAQIEVELTGDQPFQVVQHSGPDGSNQWSLKTFSPPEPTENDIVLKVDYAGVNQYDLRPVLKQNSGADTADTGEPESCRGFECVGTVISVGHNVKQFAAGDRVIAFARQGLSSLAHADSVTAVKIPDYLTFEEAVTVPIAFLSAHYSLNYLARLQEGQTVLIHEAADDTGLAAVQLAQAGKAEIYATAASEEKRAYLNRLGLRRVFDSTNYGYARQIAEQLQKESRGIDVVLNALPGQFTNKTLDLMNRFGCFIELGQDEFKPGPSQLGKITEKHISYHSVNITELINRRAGLCGELLQEIIELFNTGSLSPLPVESFAANAVENAVACLYDKSQIKKVALKFNVPGVRVMQGVNCEIIRPRRSYLVTGGLGGLGLEIMQWLAAQGAQSIVLIGRSQPSDTTMQKIDAVRCMGVEVVTMQADVASAQDVERVLSTIENDMYPLAGVIHSAGVLDDGTIAQQSIGKFMKVLSPKIKGAWNLHRLTLDSELDFFICFSSIASIIGWAGQSNYAAANAFMDVLAAHRRALGKPALTINWGPWSGSGMAANLDARDIQRMNEAGMHALSPKQGLAAISKLLAYRFPQAGVFDLDWSLIAKQYPDPAGKTLFKDFINISQADDSLDFIAQLKSVPAAQRESMLKDRIALLLAEVLGIDNAESIDKDGNVFEYGLNSLMGMDFKNRLQSVLKFKLPATLVSKYSTVDAMVQYVVENGFNEVLAGETMPDGDIVLWNPGIPDTVTNCEINGPLPFTISLLDWFKQGVSKHFNVGFLVEFGEDKFNLEALKTSLRILFTYHDGCRLQIFTEAGEPRQAIVPLGDNLRIDEYDFRGLGYAEGAARMLERNDQYEKSLTLSKGNPLFRIAHYQLDDDRPHRFLLLFHHFLTDGLSQKIFVSDLVSVYSKVFNNHPVKFPPKRNSLINWTRRLHEFAHNEAVEQLPYWESVLERSHLCYIPTDFKVERNRRNKSYNMISVSVEPGDCQRLTDLCSNYRFEITDIAVYAMIKAFSKLTLAESLWVDLVIHARTNVFDDIEMPDIFGQISECSPVLFELEPGLSVIDQLKAIRKQRVRVPTGGLGLKALRYMNKDPDIQNKIGMDEAPQIVLNFDLTNYEIEHAKEWGAIAKETNHNPAPPAVKDDYPREFYITGTVNDLGALTIVFWYYSDSFNKDTVNAIAGRIRSIFIGVANPEVLELERS